MALTTWHRDAPTHPGWFWFRGEGWTEPRIVEVYDLDGTLYVDNRPVTHMRGRWRGPILVPR